MVKFCELIQYNKARSTTSILSALFWRTKLNGTGRLWGCGMRTIANYTEKFSATCSHKCVTLARFTETSHI